MMNILAGAETKGSFSSRFGLDPARTVSELYHDNAHVRAPELSYPIALRSGAVRTWSSCGSA